MTTIIAGEINGCALDDCLIPTTANDATITTRGFNWHQAFISALTKLESALIQMRIDKFNRSRQKNST